MYLILPKMECILEVWSALGFSAVGVGRSGRLDALGCGSATAPEARLEAAWISQHGCV